MIGARWSLRGVSQYSTRYAVRCFLCVWKKNVFCRHEWLSCKGRGGTPISYRYFHRKPKLDIQLPPLCASWQSGPVEASGTSRSRASSPPHHWELDLAAAPGNFNFLGFLSSQVGVNSSQRGLGRGYPFRSEYYYYRTIARKRKGMGLLGGLIINLLADQWPEHPGNGSSSETHPVIRKTGVLIPAMDAWLASAAGAVIHWVWHQEGLWSTFFSL